MIVPEGSWVEEARGHPRKLVGLVVGLVLIGVGSPVLWSIGIVLSSLAIGQLTAYWGDETDSCVDRGSLMFVDSVVKQILDNVNQASYLRFRTGEGLEQLAGEDTVVVLDDAVPSRLDQ